VNTTEATTVLRRLVAGYPSQRLEPDTLDLWIELLEPLDYDDAQTAATDALREDEWFPSFAAFRSRCSVYARQRAPEVFRPPLPDIDPETCKRNVAKLRDLLAGITEKAEAS
jgi:hypothetical protein